LADGAAKRTIDTRGMAVAPGFIDMLGQSEMTILVNPHLPSKIFLDDGHAVHQHEARPDDECPTGESADAVGSAACSQY
jgi:hypothetical protein